MLPNDVFGIIPARGGSKGLTGKNSRELNGKPLIAWTYEAFSRAKLKNSRCILSTDSKEIADQGRGIGIEVPFLRPANLGKDDTPAHSVIDHALSWYVKNFSCHPKFILWLQPTSPFRSPEIIKQSVKLMDSCNPDAVIGVKMIERSLATMFYLDDSKKLVPIDEKESPQSRRQDVNALYTPNGTIYLIKTDVFFDKHTLFPEDSIALPMDYVSSIDIDTFSDWELAEVIASSNLSWNK